MAVEVEWLHAPGHAGSIGEHVIDLAIRQDALAIDWSEMFWNVDELRKFGRGYDHFIGKPKRKDDRGRVINHDVVISTLKSAQILHDEEFFVSKEIKENLKFMPERWGKARVVKYKGLTILIIAWHPQPNPYRRPKTVLPSYKRGVKRVEAVQERLIRNFKPDLVLNGGDLQLGVGTLWPYPNKFAKRHGMKTRRHKIDWQMWKGGLFKFVSFRKIDPAKTNPKMDHTWTILTVAKEAVK